MSAAEVIKRIKAAGWTHVRTKGSHQHFKHSHRSGITTVAHPKREIPIGTLKNIEKQSGVRLT